MFVRNQPRAPRTHATAGTPRTVSATGVAALIATAVLLSFSLTSRAADTASADAPPPTTPGVQKILDYKIPENTCGSVPVLKKTNDANGGAREHFERRTKTYTKCINELQKKLVDDFNALKESANEGNSPAQGDAIKEKLDALSNMISSVRGS